MPVSLNSDTASKEQTGSRKIPMKGTQANSKVL